MEIEVAQLSARESYRLLIACVIPRPIAWLSTLSEAGVPNLAPFSFFGGVTATPLTVMVSVGRRRGEQKDTAVNLLATGEGVIHIPHRPLAERMVETSAELEMGISEFERAGLTPIPAERVKPFRVAEAAIAMEARVARHLEVGDGPVDLFLLEVLHIAIADEFLTDGLPDPGRLAVVGRLGGIGYCDTSHPFEMPRP